MTATSSKHDSGSVVDESPLVVVANRLPVEPIFQDGDPEANVIGWRLAPGGLVSALESVLRSESALWIGAGDLPPDFERGHLRLDGVRIEPEDADDYYEGCSNSAIWPLYHDAIVTPAYHRHHFRAYRRVNQAFADRAAAVAAPGATVWIHDYHLQLVPQMLRALRPDLTIGFFLHIPFPPSALFAQLPWRGEILSGLLGSDLVGFQTHDDARSFLYSCERFLGVVAQHGSIPWGNRRVSVGAFPIGIDAVAFSQTADHAKVQQRSDEIRKEMGDPDTLLLGVDRLDYTKGIDIRLKAFAELIQDGRLDPTRTVFVQVAVPSRENISQYQSIRNQIELLVGRFNGDLSTFEATPIHYLRRVLERDELIALYLAADVMLVTPLRDGMNLVCKEYVACRNDDSGALVLSEFTGAARELVDSWLVNPYDTAGVSDAILSAVSAPEEDRIRRMRQLRAAVFDKDAQTWAHDFLEALRSGAAAAAAIEIDGSGDDVPLDEIARTDQLLVCVDFDGTIAPLVNDPDSARALPEAVRALTSLSQLPQTTVAVVSGRAFDNLSHVARLPAGVHLVGSHGAEIDHPLVLSPTQQRLLDQCTAAAQDLVALVPGAHIENKPGSIAIHVRRCEARAGVDLVRRVVMGPGRFPGVLARHGKAVIELSVAHAQKAEAVRVLRERVGASAVIFMGDDLTDESVFTDLGGADIGVKVGSGESAALWRVEDPVDVARLLARLAATRKTFV